MHELPYRLIPLMGRDNQIRGIAAVDVEDFWEMSRFVWRASCGYASRNISANGKRQHVSMHREILGLSHDDPREVDHANRDRSDNRRQNIRPVTHAENMRNRPVHRGSRSRFRAVYWEGSKGKWRARVRVNGKPIHLGYFTDEVDAGRAASDYLASIGWPTD